MESSTTCACTALRKASRAVTRIYDDRLAGHGMTITQFAVLRHLARLGDLPLSRLADALVMERTSLYRTISPLQRAGWVAVADGPSVRVKIASLTDSGLAAMENANDAWETAQRQITDAIGATALQALQGQLHRLASISAGETSGETSA